MNKNYFSNTMRNMRLVKGMIDEAQRICMESIKKANELLKNDEITKTVYEREVSKAQSEFNMTRTNILAKAKEELTLCFEKMREIATQQITTAPTPEIVSTLQILSMLDKVTPAQFNLYAESLADCPLAMQMLSQIAFKHGQRLIVEEPERRLQLLAVFEDHVANFLSNYYGTEENLSFSVRKMLPYLQTEDTAATHGGTKRIDRAFWNEFVGEGSPDCYDEDTSSSEKPKVQYFFSDVEGLLSFIKQETSCKSGSAIEETINEILANCPESYGAAYRNYKASGEIVTLHE